MTSSTEPTSSGSSALVGSSNSITRGSSAIERAMATPLLLGRPKAGPACGWRDRPNRRAPEPARPRVSASARPLPATLRSASAHVAQRRHVRIEVEGLEHHADALACMIDVGLGRKHVDAVHHDRAGGWFLQPVEAAQQRRLARARRPDHEHQLALGHLEIDTLQDMKGAEMLVDRARQRCGWSRYSCHPKWSEAQSRDLCRCQKDPSACGLRMAAVSRHTSVRAASGRIPACPARHSPV